MIRKICWVLVFVPLFLIAKAEAQHIDPVLRSLIEQLVDESLKGNIDDDNILDGALSPEKINGVALTQVTVFSGDVTGTFDSLVVVGFYPESNPSNFLDAAGVADAGFATKDFVLTRGYIIAADVPAAEIDPFFTSIPGKTFTFEQIYGTPAVTALWTGVDGVITSITTNGVEIP